MYPQAVYFPIRTLYLTLKIEQRERYKSGTSRLASWWGLRGQSAGYLRALLLQAHPCPQLPLHVVSQGRGPSLMAE